MWDSLAQEGRCYNRSSPGMLHCVTRILCGGVYAMLCTGCKVVVYVTEGMYSSAVYVTECIGVYVLE